MNVSEQIISVIDNLCQKFGVAIDWTANNVLPYIETLCGKYIDWEINTSIAWIIIAASCSLIALTIAIIVNCNGECDGFEWGFFAVIFIFSIGIIVTQVFDIIECKTFPEKAIYDYITYQISNKT